VELQVNEMKLQILDLETLIKIKEETGHDEDLAALPILRRTLQERSKK
jgi:hypothetical protein